MPSDTIGYSEDTKYVDKEKIDTKHTTNNKTIKRRKHTMPSDCQCSACGTQTVYVNKVINNKQATKMIEKLEEEVAALKEENEILRRRAKKSSMSRGEIINELKKKLSKL